MARQPEIRYINSAVCGSSAYQLNTKSAREKQVKLPKARRAKKQVIAIDPVAFGGIAVAGILLVLLLVGFVRMQNVSAQAAELNRYVTNLQAENAELRDTYESGYNLSEIEKIALAMGKVPTSEVKEISISVHVPTVEQEPTAWESFYAFLTGLFA